MAGAGVVIVFVAHASVLHGGLGHVLRQSATLHFCAFSADELGCGYVFWIIRAACDLWLLVLVTG